MREVFDLTGENQLKSGAAGNAVDSSLAACPCRRTGFHPRVKPSGMLRRDMLSQFPLAVAPRCRVAQVGLNMITLPAETTHVWVTFGSDQSGKGRRAFGDAGCRCWPLPPMLEH